MIIWVRIAIVSAAIETQRGREIAEGDKLAGRVMHRFVIRYRPGVGAPMRFVHGGRAFDIRSVIEIDGQRRWLECLCEEQTP